MEAYLQNFNIFFIENIWNRNLNRKSFTLWDPSKQAAQQKSHFTEAEIDQHNEEVLHWAWKIGNENSHFMCQHFFYTVNKVDVFKL